MSRNLRRWCTLRISSHKSGNEPGADGQLVRGVAHAANRTFEEDVMHVGEEGILRSADGQHIHKCKL